MQQFNLQYLSGHDWVLLTNKADRVRLQLGEEVVRPGSYVHYLYIVRAGSVSVELPTAQFTVTIAVLQEREAFGETAFLGDGLATASVVAKDTNVEVDRISAHDLHELCEAVPGFGSRLFRSIATLLARRLKNTSAELVRAVNRSKPGL